MIALPAFLTLLGLGTWQLERLEWKSELIDFRRSQLAGPPAPLPAELANAARALEYRRVTATGVFAHDREIFLAAISRGRAGFHVITPLRRNGGSPVLVNRGWVPEGSRAAARRAAGQIGGVVTVEGVLRGSGRQGWFTPDNDPDGNYWFWLDLPAMAAFAGIDTEAVRIDAGPSPIPGGLPVGTVARVNIPNDHLGYAITWYCLAVALAVIYVLSQRREPAASG